MDAPESIFKSGTVDLSPGWFMQRQSVRVFKCIQSPDTKIYYQRLEDALYCSTDLQTHEGQRFVEAITNAEVLIDSILCLTAHRLYRAGWDSIMQLKQGGLSAGEHPNVGLWPSAFSAMQVIVNRKTPAHRDAGAAPWTYDLLLSAGTHTQSSINLIDI